MVLHKSLFALFRGEKPQIEVAKLLKKTVFALPGSQQINVNTVLWNRHPNRSPPMLKATLESHDSNRTIQNRPIPDSESPIQCH